MWKEWTPLPYPHHTAGIDSFRLLYHTAGMDFPRLLHHTGGMNSVRPAQLTAGIGRLIRILVLEYYSNDTGNFILID